MMYSVQVDQARLLAAGYHLDRVAKGMFGLNQESIAVARLAQRVGAHGAYATLRQVVQALTKAFEAGECAGAYLGGESLVTVESGAELYLLAQSVDDVQLLTLESGDDHVKTVGAEVDGGDVVGRRRHA